MTRNMPVAPGLIPKRARRTAEKLVTKGRRKNNFAAFGITIPSRKAGTDGWWSGDI